MGIYRDMFARHHDQLALMVRLLDAGAVWLAAILASEVRFATAHAPIHLFVQYFGCAIAFIVLPGFDLYSSWRGRSLFSLATRLLSAWSLVWLVSLLLTYLLHQADSLSRLWMAYWYVFSLAALLALRVGSRAVLNLVRITGATASACSSLAMAVPARKCTAARPPATPPDTKSVASTPPKASPHQKDARASPTAPKSPISRASMRWTRSGSHCP